MIISLPRPAIAILLTLPSAVTIALGQTPSFTVHDLGTLGGPMSQATAINKSGQVAGNSTTASGQSHAFRTAPNSAISVLSDDLATLGGGETDAADINASGQVVGRSMLGTGVFHAFRTAPNAAINPSTDDLGTFGGPSSQAGGINDAGQVTGGADTMPAPSGRPHTFRTAPNGIIDSSAVDIGLHAPLSIFPGTMGTIVPTSGLRINSEGNVVGLIRFTDVGPGFIGSFVYKDGTFTSTTPGGYGVFGAINDQNQAVLSDEGYRGILWANGVETQICTCETLGINHSDQIVGGARTSSGGAPPFAYALLYENGTLYNLNNLIPANSGWLLLAATAINDLGQIAGFGTVNGQTHAFRLDPPQLPAEMVSAEITLLASFNLPAGTLNPLHALLSAAMGSLERGNNQAAGAQLRAFENLVENMTGKKLTADQASQLLASAAAAAGLLD